MFEIIETKSPFKYKNPDMMPDYAKNACMAIKNVTCGMVLEFILIFLFTKIFNAMLHPDCDINLNCDMYHNKYPIVQVLFAQATKYLIVSQLLDILTGKMYNFMIFVRFLFFYLIFSIRGKYEMYNIILRNIFNLVRDLYAILKKSDMYNSGMGTNCKSHFKALSKYSKWDFKRFAQEALFLSLQPGLGDLFQYFFKNRLLGNILGTILKLKLCWQMVQKRLKVVTCKSTVAMAHRNQLVEAEFDISRINLLSRFDNTFYLRVATMGDSLVFNHLKTTYRLPLNEMHGSENPVISFEKDLEEHVKNTRKNIKIILYAYLVVVCFVCIFAKEKIFAAYVLDILHWTVVITGYYNRPANQTLKIRPITF